MERHTGVTVLAILHFLAAASFILANYAGVQDARHSPRPVVVSLIYAAIPVALGAALWRLRNWTRVLTILLSAVGVLGSLASSLRWFSILSRSF